jgi:hypothetical protein
MRVFPRRFDQLISIERNPPFRPNATAISARKRTIFGATPARVGRNPGWPVGGQPRHTLPFTSLFSVRFDGLRRFTHLTSTTIGLCSIQSSVVIKERFFAP